MKYQELQTNLNSDQNAFDYHTSYNRKQQNGQKSDDPMDDPNYMPPELLEMQDKENKLVISSLNPRITPNTGKMILLCKKKKDLKPGCKEPTFMIGPECKNF